MGSFGRDDRKVRFFPGRLEVGQKPDLLVLCDMASFCVLCENIRFSTFFRLHLLVTAEVALLQLEGAKGPFLRVRWAVVRSLSTCSALPWRILVSRPLADRRRGAHHLAHLTDSCLLLKWCRYGVWWIFHPPLLQPARQPAQIAAMTPLSPDFSYGPSALSVNGMFDPPSPVESLVERRRVLVAPPFRALIKARASKFLWKRESAMSVRCL